MSEANLTRRQKGRSPAYPSIDLNRAIQRVEQVFKRERQYPISTSVLPELWGYAALNGPAAQQLSALLKFGLLESQGKKDDREVRVSDLAVQILNHPSPDARREGIQKAALLPAIHQELWAEYGAELPSDSNLLWRLTRDRGFTETGAKEFVREWRETLAFAELGEADHRDVATDEAAIDAEPEDDRAEDFAPPRGVTNSFDEFLRSANFNKSTQRGRSVVQAHLDDVAPPTPSSSATTVTSNVQQYPIPIALSGRPPVIISGGFPLSESEWAQFTAVLQAMKPVLVEGTDPSDGE